MMLKPHSHRLIRLMGFLSRSRELSANEVMEITKRAARKWSMSPANTIKCADFEYPRGDSYFKGEWFINGRRLRDVILEKWDRESVKKATLLAVIERRKFTPDYLEYREYMLLKRVERSERKVVQVRRIVRQFKEKLNEATKKH